MDCRHASTGLCLAMVLAFWNSVLAVEFHHGNDFHKQLNLPSSVFWSEVPLSSGIKNLTQARRVAIWVDRRLDPDRRLKFAANEPTLIACFQKLANQERIDVAWVDCIVYLGPEKTANRFATINMIHKQWLSQLPTDVQERWGSMTASSWSQLTTPVEILQAIEREVGMPIQGIEKVPHDLFRETDLPSLPAYTRLGLILAGFDLTFVWDKAGTASIRAMPMHPQAKQTYRIPSGTSAQVEKLLEGENAKPEKRSGDFIISTDWAVHQRIQILLDPPEVKSNHKQLFSLRGKNRQVGRLIEQMCDSFDMSCEFTDQARQKSEQRVTFEVGPVERDLLFTKILALVGLQASIDGDKLLVDTLQ